MSAVSISAVPTTPGSATAGGRDDEGPGPARASGRAGALEERSAG